MKNLYMCEKCGKTFSDWDEAYKCENSHIDVESLYTFNLDTQDKHMPTQFWEDGEVAPSIIIMQRIRTDSDGNYIRRKLPDGTEAYDRIPVIYKRSVLTELPNGLKKRDYYDAMLRRQDIDHPAIETIEEKEDN